MNKAEDAFKIFWIAVGSLLAVALCVLIVHAIYSGYTRGEAKREAENKTKIERQINEQKALRQYRGER